MANKIQLRRGTFATLPALSAGEPAFCTDTKQLFIGDGTTNIDITAPDKEDYIINGGFDVWQRGTSQTSSGYGSDDRWQNINFGLTKTHSKQTFISGQTEVPNNPNFFSRTVVNANTDAAQNYCIKEQHIEEVAKLSGKTITLSFWAKADATKKLGITIDQVFGTGGSTAVIAFSTNFSLTTSWKRYTFTITLPSVSGKTIGANSYTNLRFWFSHGTNYPFGVGSQTGTFDIANVTFVEGRTAKEWQPENLAVLMEKCKRYYEFVNAFGGNQFSVGVNSAGDFFAPINFSDKRCIPTITPSATMNVTCFGVFTGAFSVNGTSWLTSRSAVVSAHTGNQNNVTGICDFQWIADAEI